MEINPVRQPPLGLWCFFRVVHEHAPIEIFVNLCRRSLNVAKFVWKFAPGVKDNPVLATQLARSFFFLKDFITGKLKSTGNFYKQEEPTPREVSISEKSLLAGNRGIRRKSSSVGNREIFKERCISHLKISKYPIFVEMMFR